MVKRCLDISKQCELDIILIMRDKKNDRVREVHTSHQLTLDDLNKLVTSNDRYQGQKYRCELASHVLKDEESESVSGAIGTMVEPIFEASWSSK